jgi:hypothetical protein
MTDNTRPFYENDDVLANIWSEDKVDGDFKIKQNQEIVLP